MQGEECQNHIAERSRSEITAKQKLDESGVRRKRRGPSGILGSVGIRENAVSTGRRRYRRMEKGEL